VEAPLGNYLKMAHTTRVQALVELSWSYRRIERETAAKYDPRRVFQNRLIGA
jgi:hypothetical protein